MAKEKFKISYEFIDAKTGEYLGNDVNEIVSNMPKQKQAQYKLLLMEATTGKKYKIVEEID